MDEIDYKGNTPRMDEAVLKDDVDQMYPKLWLKLLKGNIARVGFELERENNSLRSQLQAAEVVLKEAIDKCLDKVVLEVAELPDRNSPYDYPEIMLVTREELQAIFRKHLYKAFPKTSPRIEALIKVLSWGHVWIAANKARTTNSGIADDVAAREEVLEALRNYYQVRENP